MTEPEAHLRRFIRTSPRHHDVRVVGGLDTVIDRSSAFTDVPRSPRDVAASEHDRRERRNASPHARHSAASAEHDRIERASTPAPNPANWHARWRDLLGRLRHRLEADADRE